MDAKYFFSYFNFFSPGARSILNPYTYFLGLGDFEIISTKNALCLLVLC